MVRVSKDPEIRRKEFIDAAAELFNEKGFDNTSVSDITNKVGLSHGSFFYYFKSKKEIMKEVIFDGLNEIRYSIRQIVDNKQMNAIDKFQTILKLSADVQDTHDEFVEYSHRESNVAMHREYTLKSREMLLPLFIEIIEQGVKEGTFNLDYPAETMVYLTYIFENMDDSIESSKTEEEYYRKMRALDILIIKALGIPENTKLLNYYLKPNLKSE
jgi:AcrR family transcriptional regulator